jgi:acyl-CoA thioesterase
MAEDLALDTAVKPIPEAPGWYEARLSDAWSWLLPAGGVLMTVALRAIQAELADPGLRPISATALFCKPVPAGPLEVRVEILRRGNAVAQVRAALRAVSSRGPDLEVSATFGRERPGLDRLDAEPPDVPRPEEARMLEIPTGDEARPRFPFLTNFEDRVARGHTEGARGVSTGPARFARWIRYLVPQRSPDGTLDPLAIPPIADMMPSAFPRRSEPGAQSFYAPSLDLTVHFLDPTESAWLLVSVWARRARGGYASAEVEIWGEDRRLVAYGTQTMILRRRAR